MASGGGMMNIIIILLVLAVVYFLYKQGYLDSFLKNGEDEKGNAGNAPQIDSIQIGLSNAPVTT
jgi:hypothetical protein